ncbi:MAG: HAD-IA family hydrolase [Solirubrobacterales bacterium]|nr:HAD-IA family hydrolase [Solirubrobacterales bacterium]
MPATAPPSVSARPPATAAHASATAPGSATPPAPAATARASATAPAPAAILLDALGTLVALEPPAPLLRSELATRFGVDVSEAEAARAIAAEIAHYRAHLDEGRDSAGLDALRRRCADVLRSALPDGVGRWLELDPLVDALLASLRFSDFPDVRPALEAARARGQRLVVVSNWDVSLVGVLRGLELEPLLDGILTSAMVGARKPATAIFEQALALAGVGPDQAVHVGDSLDEDVAGARAAGIEPVLIRRGGGPPVPRVRTISSLSELITAAPA